MGTLKLTVEFEIDCHKRLYPSEVGFSLANMYSVTVHLFVSAWEGLELECPDGAILRIEPERVKHLRAV